MQSSAQEFRREWPGSSANIRQGKRENVAQLARMAAIDTAQAADLLEALRLALRRRIVGECVKCSGGVLRLERWRRWLQVLADGMRVGCNPSRVNRASVAALVVCVQDSKQESTQDNACRLFMHWANSCGACVARWLSLRGVGMRGQYGTLDNACSVGVLRLLSMCSANTINSKAARLYVWGSHVVRCMCGGMYGRTYDALLFAHGIYGHNGCSIIHALLLRALAICQRACNKGHRGI